MAKQAKQTKNIGIGEEFERFNAENADIQKRVFELAGEIEKGFDRKNAAIFEIKKLRTKCSLCIENGDKGGLDATMHKIVNHRKSIENVHKECQLAVGAIDQLQTDLAGLQSTGRIWSGRADARFRDGFDFRQMVGQITTNFGVMGGRLHFLKMKIQKLEPPAEPDRNVQCPRCHSSAVELVRADVSTKTFRCSTAACKQFSVPLMIPTTAEATS